MIKTGDLFYFEQENPNPGLEVKLTWTLLSQGFLTTPLCLAKEKGKLEKENRSRFLLQSIDDILPATKTEGSALVLLQVC